MRLYREQSSALRTRCRFRIGVTVTSWPSSIVGGYLSGIGSRPVRLLSAPLTGDRDFVERELWWAGYSPPSTTLRHVEAR